MRNEKSGQAARIRPDDNVIVTKGRDRGKTGRVQQVFPKEGKVLVEGVNIVLRHTKPTQGIRQGGIIQKEMPVRLNNVMLICPSTNEPTRVGYTRLADGTKARVSKKSGEIIE